MAKGIKEFREKQEDLTEQGERAEREVRACTASVNNAAAAVERAEYALKLAEETDEEGHPRGNVSAAIMELDFTRNILAAEERALEAAKAQMRRIQSEKTGLAEQISQYNAGERENLQKLSAIQSLEGGGRAQSLYDAIVNRMNEAEDLKARLYRSMGISYQPNYTSQENLGSASFSGGASPLRLRTPDISSASERIGGDSQLSGAVAAPVGGGLRSGPQYTAELYGMLTDAGITSASTNEDTSFAKGKVLSYTGNDRVRVQQDPENPAAAFTNQIQGMIDELSVISDALNQYDQQIRDNPSLSDEERADMLALNQRRKDYCAQQLKQVRNQIKGMKDRISQPSFMTADGMRQMNGTNPAVKQDIPKAASVQRAPENSAFQTHQAKAPNTSGISGPSWEGMSIAPQPGGSNWTVLRGNYFDKYSEIAKNYSAHPVEDLRKSGSDYTVMANPNNIEGVYLSPEEISDPVNFWERMHGGSREAWMETASHIPEVQTRLTSGESLDALMDDERLGRCAKAYFNPNHSEPICVIAMPGGGYSFEGSGRHRIIAARAFGYDIPVKVIGKYKQ